MKTTGIHQRIALGCGYLPHEGASSVWQPPSGNDRVGYKGAKLTTCAGYTANLPEVIEASIARAHWKVGALALATDGEPATEDLLNSILIYDAECSALESWLVTPSADGGGGK